MGVLHDNLPCHSKRGRATNKKQMEDTSGKYTLCFPSISTNAFAFDLETASTVATQVIKEWLQENPDPRIRLYLVDISESYTLRKFREVRLVTFFHQ